MAEDRKRRGHGEGSIFERADGKWVAVLDLGRHPDTGKRMRRKASASSRGEALKALKRLEREAAAGHDRTSTKVTVGQWADAWLSSAKHRVEVVGDMKPRTLKAYDICVRVHIKPALGSTRIDALSRSDVERFYRGLQDVGMEPSTIGRVAVALRSVVAYALEEGAVAGNVAARVKSPKVERDKAPALAGVDLKRLLGAAEGDSRRLFETMSLTGLRIGEAVALRWTDLRLDAKVPTLTVARTAGRRSGEVGAPKSKSSARTVPLTAEAVKVLKRQRTAQNAARLAHPLWRGDEQTQTVFPAADGAPLGSTVHWWWTRARKAAGLDESYVPHSLRHGWVRRLLTDGVPPVVVADLAGDTLATLLDYYADAIETDDGSAIAAMVAGALA